jgi:hypothetical protein
MTPVLLASFGLVLTAHLPGQEGLVLPDDPLAAVASMVVHESPLGGIFVEVSDEKGERVSGASVLMLEGLGLLSIESSRQFDTLARAQYGSAYQSQLARLVLYGRRFVTDSRGRTQIPRTANKPLVFAVFGRTTATNAPLLWGDEIVRMVLRPSRFVHVLVVDAHGQAVPGVPVGLEGAPIERTDGNGRATLGLDALRSTYSRRARVRLRVAVPDPIFADVDADTLENQPDRPIQLQLPPFGTVQVTGRSSDGEPVEGLNRFALSLASESDSRSALRAFPREIHHPDEVEGNA